MIDDVNSFKNKLYSVEHLNFLKDGDKIRHGQNRIGQSEANFDWNKCNTVVVASREREEREEGGGAALQKN